MLSTTVRWSYLDIALFRYLNALTQKNTNDLLRDAVRTYARTTPGFSATEFEAFAKKSVLPEAEPGPLKDAFVAELKQFVATAEDDNPLDEFAVCAEDFVFEQ